MQKLTTQIQVRAAFWTSYPELSRKKIKHYSGTGKMYTTDTRCAFVDFVDYLRKSGIISEALAARATLGDK